MQIKKIVGTIIFMLLGPNVMANYHLEKVDITFMINQDRKSVRIFAKPQKDYGMVCSDLRVNVKLENPRLYMESGDFEANVEDFFVYPESEDRIFAKDYLNDRLALINEKSEDEIIIKSLSPDYSWLKCRRASFYDYCSMASKDAAEKFSLFELGKKLNRTSCRSLGWKLNERFLGFKKDLNISNTKILDFRFLKYLSSVHTVYVGKTFKDRSNTLSFLKGKGFLNVFVLDEQLDLPLEPSKLNTYLSLEELEKMNEFNFN